MKQILIALDYDPTAQKVAETGFTIAKSMNAEITLLHVLSESEHYSTVAHTTIMGFGGFPYIAPLTKDEVELLNETCHDFLEKSKHHLGDESIKTLVKKGNIAEAILLAAHETHAEAIVIGSHSQKWLENILMGSVTEEVLKQTKIPLFIIPTKKH